jgi:hypothetical protein
VEVRPPCEYGDSTENGYVAALRVPVSLVTLSR